MPSIRVKENEPFEVAMRRFKRSIEKTGLLTELRAREAYEKPTTERKRKKAAAVKRLQKRLRSQQLPPKLYYSFEKQTQPVTTTGCVFLYPYQPERLSENFR